MVKHYVKRVGVNIEGFGAHSLRATAATNQYIRLGAHFHFRATVGVNAA